MSFSRDFIDKVREANNIVDLIGHYTVLRQSGANFMGRCPFPDHADKSASFSVSEDKQLYHCFGCKKSGTVYNFVQTFQGLSFPEAVEFLANRAGLEIEREDQPQSPKATDSREIFYNINQLAFESYVNKLKASPEGSAVKEYLKKRGLSAEIVEEFGLGYAPDSWDFIAHKLQGRFSPTQLTQCGLLAARKGDSTGFYDRFRDRLIFPIKNTMGKCIGFGGRILENGEPKYLNSPETPVFHKGRVLYGLDRNARYVRSEDEIILVEGYMDLISLAQFGIRNVAATLGTALTADHAKLIQRMTKNVLVLFDGDQAGISAAEKSLPILLRAGLRPKGLTLPDKQDPDDFVRAQGKEGFEAEIKKAPELFDLVVARWLEGYDGSATEKMKLVEKLAPVVAEMADAALRQLYLRELAAKINVDPTWLRSALWQQMKVKQVSSIPASPTRMASNAAHNRAALGAAEISLKNAAVAELTLMGLALKTRENFNLIEEAGVSEYLVHEGIRTLYSRVVEKYRQAPDSFDRLLASVLPYVDQPEKLSSAFEGAVGDSLTEHRVVEDCIEKVKKLHLKQRGSQLSVAAKLNPNNKNNLEELMNVRRQFLGLRNIKENYETED